MKMSGGRAWMTGGSPSFTAAAWNSNRTAPGSTTRWPPLLGRPRWAPHPTRSNGDR